MYNGILVIDKPEGFSSHDVVAKLRRIFGQKRVGHGGTLDPMATGVLPVFAGRSTHAAGYVQDGGKTYVAKMRLGLRTDTQDTSGTTLTEVPVDCTPAEVEAAARRFLGEIDQIPPMYSAISQNGVRLYKLARQGLEVERQPRRVTVYSINLLSQQGAEYELEVACSKGLYIRTLIADIGESLGCGAAMSALRRTKAGPFDISEAITLEKAAELAEAGELHAALRRADLLYAALPAYTVPDRDVAAAKNGGKLAVALPDGELRLYGGDGEFLGTGTASHGILHLSTAFYD